MRWSYVCAAAFASLAAFSMPALTAPPVEAFGNLPVVETARLSPDGKSLAVIGMFGGQKKVEFIDLTKADSQPFITGMQGGLPMDVVWKTADRAIVTFHRTLKYKHYKDVNDWARAIVVTPSKQKDVLLGFNAPFFLANPDGADIVDLADGDPDHVYMMFLNKYDYEYMYDLFSIDLSTGAATLALHTNPHTVRYILDGYGHVLGRIEQDSSLNDRVQLSGKEVLTYPTRGGSPFGLVGLTAMPDPHFVVKLAAGDAATTGLYLWDGKSDRFGDALFSDPRYDLVDAVTNERNGRVIGYTYIDDLPRTKYFDPALQHVLDMLEKAYPGQSVSILSMDDAAKSFVIETQGPRNPPVLSLFTTANHQSNIIAESYPDLKPSDLAEVKAYPYKSNDGTDIHAYLTLPPGKDPHNLPAVIFPHGGPEARDAISFDWWAQFMASRGYAVLQPNFRGSSGYGWNFVKAGDGEWAGKVQEDVQAGVHKLIADGIVDPKRICIVGASYGGYMALAGATFSPDLYACAVSYAGLSDLEDLLDTGTLFESEGITILKRRIGADIDSGKPAKESPVNFADRVKIPILLIHGDRDTTVPIHQSEIEEKALKRAGKDVQFVTLQGDDHYLEFAPTRIQLLKEIERFLAANIGH